MLSRQPIPCCVGQWRIENREGQSGFSERSSPRHNTARCTEAIGPLGMEILNEQTLLSPGLDHSGCRRFAAGCHVEPVDSESRHGSGRAGSRRALVDTQKVMASIDERIYGHFLEHINHSVEDGLFAEQIQGCGFEGKDFETYWKLFSERGTVEIANVAFKNGNKSVRLRVEGGRAGIRQRRLFVDGDRSTMGRSGPGASKVPRS